MTLHHARVAAVGTEAQMAHLCQAMLRNAGADSDMPGALTGLADAIRRHAAEEAGPDCGFLYEMIARRPFGDAEEDTCRFTVRREGCGLWTALFSYDSRTPFQPEDWHHLHMQCDRLPMLILRACDDYDRDKGMLVLSGGYLQEEWSRMEECWLWLVSGYGADSQEAAVKQLTQLARLLEDEDDELTVPALLERCGRFLQRMNERLSDADGLRDALALAVQHHDYQTLFHLQCQVALGALWEADRAERWQRCLEALSRHFPA